MLSHMFPDGDQHRVKSVGYYPNFGFDELEGYGRSGLSELCGLIGLVEKYPGDGKVRPLGLGRSRAVKSLEHNKRILSSSTYLLVILT
jgi:hypothetical protein